MKFHNELNPKIWNADHTLKDDVKDRLLQIVSYFTKDSYIPINVLDARIVGSNASYNYTPFSDLDLHLVVNFEQISDSKELIQALFDLQKTLFNKAHDISIHGVNVELYVEDVNAMTLSNGIYSLFEDKWIKEPEKLTDVPDVDITKETNRWRRVIETALSNGDINVVSNLINRLYMIRKNALSIDGEYSKGNQIFKAIRNDGLLDKLKDRYKELVSKDLSLESLHK